MIPRPFFLTNFSKFLENYGGLIVYFQEKSLIFKKTRGCNSRNFEICQKQRSNDSRKYIYLQVLICIPNGKMSSQDFGRYNSFLKAQNRCKIGTLAI